MILELPLRRFRQIMSAIVMRHSDDDKVARAYLQLQTKTIAQFIAAAAPVGKGKRNPLLDQANKIDFFKKPGQTTKASQENKPGSYERLMGMMGGGPRG